MRLQFQIAVLAWCVVACAAQADSLRPQVGMPLRVAQELVKAKQYTQALAKVREAQAVPNKTAYESYTLERMRMSAAIGAADMADAAGAFEALSASGRLAADDKLNMLAAVASGYYRAKEYAKAATWTQRYLNEGGANPKMRKLLPQSRYLSGDAAGATRELRAEIEAGEKAGTRPAQARLNLLLNAAARQNNDSDYLFALEKLLAHYPTKAYWAELLDRVQRKAGFSNRYALDIYRLRLASASMRSANDYMEMAQLALLSGLAAEAKAALEQGFATQVLGTGEPAQRHQRLRDLASKQAGEECANVAAKKARASIARHGTALVELGFGLAMSGQPSKGIALIEQGIAKPGLARPDDAQLRLGQALVLAGQRAKAVSVLARVTGKNGAADLARLWVLLKNRAGR